jgi:hypothetical protein
MVLICPISLMADSVIISVTAPPALSTLILGSSVVSTSWSESQAYSDVAISVLVDSAIVGQTPSADAFLTTNIGPGTTATDEISHTRFTVPVQLPVCSAESCGAVVTLFSGLNLGPGDYFLTIAPDAMSSGFVGWFPALNPTVVEGAGVSAGTSFLAAGAAFYPPASAFGDYAFGGYQYAMNFTVTEAATSPIPEPATAPMIGLGALVLLVNKRIARLYSLAKLVGSRLR